MSFSYFSGDKYRVVLPTCPNYKPNWDDLYQFVLNPDQVKAPTNHSRVGKMDPNWFVVICANL